MDLGFTPARHRGVELLDDPRVDPGVRSRSIADVARSNSLFGGRRAVAREVQGILATLGTRATLLDVGTGHGDIPAELAMVARRAGVQLDTVGIDRAPSLVHAARLRLTFGVCGEALALPFASHSIDVVLCSQLLHHFDEGDALRLIAELDRVARTRVIIADLRRSWIAAGGFWLASFPLRFHAVTRHDGTLSVLRGFTRAELSSLVERASGVRPVVRRRLAYRVTASWTPRTARAAETGLHGNHAAHAV